MAGRRPTKREQARVNVAVVDGHYAPKLTGSDRLKSRADMDAATSLSTDGEGTAKKGMLSAAAAQGAVTFGLGLFHAHLKRGTFAHLELANGSNSALRAMADPFVGLLSVAIKTSGDNQVTHRPTDPPTPPTPPTHRPTDPPTHRPTDPPTPAITRWCSRRSSASASFSSGNCRP